MIHIEHYAMAMLRRLPKHYSPQATPTPRIRVLPFGLGVTVAGYDSRFITYVPTEGLILCAARFSAGVRDIAAKLLSAVEVAGGYNRRWVCEERHLGFIDMPGDIINVVRVREYRDYQVLDTLQCALLDAKYADVTPAGQRRDWRAEMRAYFARYDVSPRAGK